jgi:hypothetical protein
MRSGFRRLELVIEKVSHDQIVKVVLVCVVALIKNENCDLLHVQEAVHQKIVKLLCHRHKHVMTLELCAPSFLLRVVFVTASLSTEVATDSQIRVSFDRYGLLLDQVLYRHDEKDLLGEPRRPRQSRLKVLLCVGHE